MGKRKQLSAEKRKEALKTQYFAKLNDVPSSPRKMRLVCDMIRGMEVNRALGTLKFSTKAAAFCYRQLGTEKRAKGRSRRTVRFKDLCGWRCHPQTYASRSPGSWIPYSQAFKSRDFVRGY